MTDAPLRDDSSITGRVKRYAKVGTAVGGLAARYAGGRFLGLDLDTGAHAGELKAALGGLKGPLMKVAQILSTIPDVLPEEYTRELRQLQTNAPATVKIEYWEQGNSRTRFATNEVRTQKSDAFTAHLLADAVQPGKTYDYRLLINGKAVQLPYPLSFQSQKLWQWREDPPAFSFLIGSCFYVNDPPYDRPGTPYGSDFEVLDAMYDAGGDFMVWMGDNIYLREVDWYTRTGIQHRYTHARSQPALQPLLANVHHYAIWDDHDFGPNDSDRSYIHKDKTREAFELFWANPSTGLDGEHGITSFFQWADIDFFLLDNRFFRSPNDCQTCDATILGKAQLDWLIEALVYSKASFKVVVIGGQVLNPAPVFENYAHHHGQERLELLRRIETEGIRNVLFVSGDRHHTELSQLTLDNGITLYDWTVSPLTSNPSRNNEREGNTLRVPGTYVNDQNFGIMTVTGPRKDRRMNLTIVDAEGNPRWTREIRQER